MKGPTYIDNWEFFLQQFEAVFDEDWANTLSMLPTIGAGTFLRPQSSQTPVTWEKRDQLLESYRALKPNVELASIEVQKFRDETAKYETWITGEVFSERNQLLFKADRQIANNSTGDVVKLGVKLGLEKIFLPLYVRAAEKRLTLRLYGVLVANEILGGSPSQTEVGMPNTVFVTWKCHLPTDPDEVPESLQAGFTSEDRISGYHIRLESDSATQSLLQSVLKEFELLQHHPRSSVIVMHGFIELLVNALVEEKCKSGKKMSSNTRDYPHSVKLTLLHELNILDDVVFKNLSWFRKLRNDAAHEAIFVVSPEKLQMFVETKFAEVQHFPLLCMDIFTALWNAHSALFSSKFSPELPRGTILAQPAKGRTFHLESTD